jgi:hypothetical protein
MDQYSLNFDEHLHLVKVVAHGDLPRPLGEEIITKARILASEYDCGILYDVRKASVNVSLADWFFMPRELEVLQGGKTRSRKAAVVVSASEEDEYRFYETVVDNLGLNIKIFLTEEEAIDWLAQRR